MVHYILASKDTPYAKILYERLVSNSHGLDLSYPISWSQVKDGSELNIELKKHNPDEIGQIFFFHWNHKVTRDIYEVYPCVAIHTSNLPQGRGGSPLQNQIVEGIWQSRVNALKMIGKMDAGGIYLSEEITLQGSVDDIWWTIMLATEKLIMKMLNNPHLIPKIQLETTNSLVEVYKRRKPEQSKLELTEIKNLRDIYDNVRMLDGIGYPKAYLEIAGYRLELSRAKMDYVDQSNGEKVEELVCDIRIKKVNNITKN
jgi:methionyl-tRNA formyltransferase